MLALLISTVGASTVSAKQTAAPSVQSNGPPTIIPVAGAYSNHHKTYLVITTAKVDLNVRHPVDIFDHKTTTVDERTVVEGFLKEQVGNKPNPATDPGVKNTPVVLSVNWPGNRYFTNEARTAWWDGSGWFKFDYTDPEHFAHWSPHGDPSVTIKYTVEFKGYDWYGQWYERSHTELKDIDFTTHYY